MYQGTSFPICLNTCELWRDGRSEFLLSYGAHLDKIQSVERLGDCLCIFLKSRCWHHPQSNFFGFHEKMIRQIRLLFSYNYWSSRCISIYSFCSFFPHERNRRCACWTWKICHWLVGKTMISKIPSHWFFQAESNALHHSRISASKSYHEPQLSCFKFYFR